MKNLNQNRSIAEMKLKIIDDILKLPFKEVENQFLLRNRFNYELSEEQARYMRIKASDIILGNTGKVINDFEITTNSFKSMKINFEYLHFHFIDKNSISQDFDILINDFEHDLYYVIIACNQDGDLLQFDFDDADTYDAYIINGNLDVEKIQVFNKIKYENVRKKFLLEVGEKIRRNSTYNLITEYITFDKQHVEKFRNELNAGTTFKVRVVSICEDGDINSTSVAVSNYLKDPGNQKKLSLAFQKFDNNTNSDFYDIGNMHP